MARGSQGGDARRAGPADLADRPRCPLDGDQRAWLRRRGLQRAGCVEAKHHLIVTYEVTTTDQIGAALDVAKETKAMLDVDELDASPIAATSTARRSWPARSGHYGHAAQADDLELKGTRALRRAGLRYLLRRTFTSVLRREARLPLYNEENGLVLRRYWTNACQSCAIKQSCTTGKERRIARWEHEHVLEAVQRRLDEHPEKMRQRRETVEHPFGTIKARMGATHFLMKRCQRSPPRWRCTYWPTIDPRYEHHGCPTADGGDDGIV